MAWRDWIKTYLKRDKETKVADESRGVSIGTPPTTAAGASMETHGSGSSILGEMLAVDTDLMRRYADYENMDDYAETCLGADSLVFTVERGWVRIQELAESREDFHVLAYDRELRSLVPARGCDARMTGRRGHSKPMVRVVLDDGREVRCTADHLFMRKDGSWVKAADLLCGDRLMPGVVRMRSLNSAENQPYWQVHQPHSDSQIEGRRQDRQQRWVWVHRLVVEYINGDIDAPHVHHKDGNPLNNAPGNLEGLSLSEHAHRHIAGIDNSEHFPEWTDDRRAEMALRMQGNAYRRGAVMSDHARRKISDAHTGRSKSEEWKKRIGLAQPNRIDLRQKDVEAALESGGSVAGAARILGVSWSKAKRAAVEYDLLADGGNHRVMSVERVAGGEPVYDLTVPGYSNFVCNGVVVHNSAALDIYADDATIPDSVHGKTIWGTSRDRVIRDIIDDCLHRRLRLEEDIWVAVRTLCKYGNCFAEILVNEIGVVGLNWLPVPTMRRIVDEKGALIGFVQDTTGTFGFDYKAVVAAMKKSRLPDVEEEGGKNKLIFFRSWEVVHWRLRSKMMRAQYGYSVLDSARWVWKRLQMMEDTALVQKLTRAPGRYAFYVDTGDLPPREAMALVKKVKRAYKKKKFVDPATGQLDFKYNPLSPHEDFFIPTRGGKESTRIDVVSGPDVQMMDDVEYFLRKLIAAIKIPRSYLGLGEAAEETSKSLAEADVRFARACMRIQREFIMGVRKIIRLHMAALNIDPDSVDWKIKMSVPSAIFEMQQVELMNAQAALASSMAEWASKPWILQHIFHFTEDDSAFIWREKTEENDETAKKDAGTQADIMRMYPELQELPPVGDEGAVAESQMGAELIGLKKVLQETSQTSSEVVKRFEKLESRMVKLEKTARRRAVSG